MRRLALVVSLVLLSGALLWAQSSPRLTAIEPDTAKVGAQITVTGENIGKATVVAVFLSDANSDFKATLLEQTAEKIVLKVPQVKAGKYNISLQVKNEIYIQPVHVTVQD